MTKTIDDAKWRSFVETLDVSPCFVTVSGAHLYGFPSVDSDVDLRGCHVVEIEKMVGRSI